MSKPPTSDARPVATVWLVDGRTVADEKLLSYAAWLNPDEMERYRRFVRPQRQRQFLIGRILLRFALGKLLEVAPETLLFSERRGHAPLLTWASPAPAFSLSHSGPWIACAVGEQTALGLDIEVMDPTRDLIALGEQVFAAEETTFLKTQEGSARVIAFYELWSSKEARYKLASNGGPLSGKNCIVLPHQDMAIVLCSALPLAEVWVCPFHDW